MTLKSRLSVWLTWFLFFGLSLAAWRATSFDSRAAYFPVATAGVGAFLAALDLFLSRRRARGEGDAQAVVTEDAAFRHQMRGGALNLAWLGLYILGMITLGFFTSTVAFLFLMLRIGAKTGRLTAFALAVGTCVFLYLFGTFLGLAYPPGLVDGMLFEAVGL